VAIRYGIDVLSKVRIESGAFFVVVVGE